MFQALTVRIFEADVVNRTPRKRNRRVLLEWNSPDPAAPVDINGKMITFIAADKRALKIIKFALRNLANKTGDPNFFDPVADKDEIDAVNKTDDDVRVVFDIASSDNA